MYVTEREIPTYYQEIKTYLDREIKAISPEIKLIDMGWGFKVDKAHTQPFAFKSKPM